MVRRVFSSCTGEDRAQLLLTLPILLDVFYSYPCAKQRNTHPNNPSRINSAHTNACKWQNHMIVNAQMLIFWITYTYIQACVN